MNVARHEIPCPFCERYYRQAVIVENGYQGVRCPVCQLLYISPRPPWEELLQLYATAPLRPRVDSHPGAAPRRRKAWHTLSRLRPNLRGRTVLEIGPGDGSFLLALRQHGFSVFGIELNGPSADFLHNTLHIPCETRPLTVSSFEGEKFDLIYHCDVLSHLYDPLADFAMMHAKLKDRGLLAFETGNLGELYPRYYHCYPNFRYPEHLWFFGEKSLRLLLQRTGFELISLHRYSLQAVLFLEKCYLSLRKTRGAAASAVPGCGAPAPAPSRKSWVRSFLGKMYHELVDYLLPYRLGPHVPRPRPGRPQTLIVVARKSREGGSRP